MRDVVEANHYSYNDNYGGFCNLISVRHNVNSTWNEPGVLNRARTEH